MRIIKTVTTLFVLMFTIGFLSCTNDNNTANETNRNPETNQESAIEFVKHFETKDSIFTLNSVVQSSDSSYTIGGAVRYNESFNKNLLMKFDKYGNRKWTRVMESSFTPNGIEKLFQNGNGYIGYRGHHYDVENSSHFIYYNQRGNVENEIFLNKDFLGNDIVKVENNFLIAGSNGRMAFRMLNQNGGLIWEIIYDLTPDAFSISRLTDENYISIGGSSTNAQGDYLVKLNELGEEIWTRNYKGLEILGITNNEFLAVIIYEGNWNLVKFNQEGNIMWNMPLEDFRANVNKPNAMSIIDYENEFFVCSYTNNYGHLNILVFDRNGNKINFHKFEDGEYTMVSKTIDNGLLIANYDSFYKFNIIKLSKDFIIN
jgi:hypothetical protein